MYEPPHFIETRDSVLHSLITSEPLGLLVSNGPDGPVADPIPFTLHENEGEHGILRAHLARSNPHWQLMASQPDLPVLVVFQGPQAYVTPSWYPTKAETGKVVPTWNYVTVQVSGLATIHPDPQWLLAQVNRLTESHEQAMPKPWAVNDAPDDFVSQQLRAIIGIEIVIAQISGKWKASQNRSAADKAGVAQGMILQPKEQQKQMAALVQQRVGAKDQ